MMLSKKQKRLIDKFEMDMEWNLCDMPYKITLYMFMTMQCNLACKDCFVGCSPSRSNEYMAFDDIVYYVNHFRQDFQFKNSILFTGGEATLNLDTLSQSLDFAMKNKMNIGLKSNGMWALAPKTAEPVYSMFGNLFDRNDPYRNSAGELPLGLDISVDNVLHPKSSAKAFKLIAQRLSQDHRLGDNMNLSAMGFSKSKDWFKKQVIQDRSMNFTVLEQRPFVTVLGLNGKDIYVHMHGTVIKPAPITEAKELRSVLPQLAYANWPTLSVRFYPDKTVGLSTSGLKSCGRVPYLDSTGAYKSWAQIRSDIVKKLTNEYAKIIQNER